MLESPGHGAVVRFRTALVPQATPAQLDTEMPLMRPARCSLIVFLLGGLACLAAAGADPDQPAARKSPAKPAIRAAVPIAAVRKAEHEAEAAVNASAKSFAEAYNRHDAKAIAAGFTTSAEFVTEEGTVLHGREAIEQHFAAVFTDVPDSRVALRVEAVRVIADNVVVEEGTVSSVSNGDALPEHSRYVAVHVKQEGRWLVARTRDFPHDSDVNSNYDHLRGLEFLVGDWMGEGENILTRTSCQWIDDRNFLLQEFTVEVSARMAVKGTTRIGWDPQLKQVRSWTFDSQGGLSEGVWTHVGDEWLLKTRGVTHLGHSSSSTTILRRIDASTLQWESRDRVDGVGLTTNIKPILVKRRPPPPAE